MTPTPEQFRKADKILCRKIKLIGENEQTYVGLPYELIEEIAQALADEYERGYRQNLAEGKDANLERILNSDKEYCL